MGEHLTQDVANTFEFNPLEISFALGISMHWSADPVVFAPLQVFIGAVGADFEFED